MMKRVLFLVTALSIAVLIPGLSALAQDVNSQLAALQQRADRIQAQMNEAKQQCGSSLNSQVKSLNASIENLVKQRVQLGSQISQLESQVEELKSNAIASCGRSVKQYEDELGNIKQQIASLTSKKAAEPPKVNAQPAASVPAPAPALAPLAASKPMTTAAPTTAPVQHATTPGSQGIAAPHHR
jgi:peptidoglycan hydrolase CwlO-like protein